MSDSLGKEEGAPLQPEAWLLRQTLAVRSELLQVVGLSLLGGLLIVLQARLLAKASYQVVAAGGWVPAVLPIAGGLGLVAVLRGGCLFLAERRSAAAAARVKEGVRRRLHRQVQELGPAGRYGGNTGSLVEVLTSAVEDLEPYIARFLPQLFQAALLPLLVLLVVIPSEWRSGAILLFSAPFIPLFMVLIGRGSEILNRRQWGRLSRLAGHLLDLVQGLPDLKMCAAARAEAAALVSISAEYRQGTMAILRVAFLSAFTLEFFATVGTAVVAVLIGFRLLGGTLTLESGLFVLLLAPEFYLPLRALGLSYHARMQGVAAAERIAPLLAQPLPLGYEGREPVPSAPLGISFHQVGFRYGGERGGVTGIDLELPAGSCTALAGESGSGKSTLVRLLVGLARPETGKIRINGLDLGEIEPVAWRQQLALVPQRPFFFTGTIGENLLLGCPEATESAILEALAEAGALDFVQRLPDGLASRLGDRGAGLSGGELRRLALARVFLRNPSVVILDEPTAGLDPASERQVLQALRRLAAGRTLLIISHREETLALAERVVVLAAGKVLPRALPAELSGPEARA